MAKIHLKAAAAFVWPLIVKATKQTENGCRQATCMQNLNKIGQKMGEMHLKAAAAFVWPLLVKAMKQIENGCRLAICTPNMNKIGEETVEK